MFKIETSVFLFSSRKIFIPEYVCNGRTDVVRLLNLIIQVPPNLSFKKMSNIAKNDRQQMNRFWREESNDCSPNKNHCHKVQHLYCYFKGDNTLAGKQTLNKHTCSTQSTLHWFFMLLHFSQAQRDTLVVSRCFPHLFFISKMVQNYVHFVRTQ